MHLTSRIVINPSWLAYPAQPGELVIRLDPGSSFGTGMHETTALCVEQLDRLVQPGFKVLDVGTGSGILAIIAARLGASYVEALDIDDLALAAARENIAQNAVDVQLGQGDIRAARTSGYDLIVANIIADVVIDLLPAARQLLADQGLLLVSGIIAEKLAPVQEAARALQLQLLHQQTRKDWCALLYQKK